jgi:hypothetical protein
MNKFSIATVLIALTTLMLSCKKDITPEPQFHYDYYSLETGKYVVYEAMEIRHDVQALIQRDTNRFFLKTVIGESITDLEGDTAYKFFRYTKNNISDEWVIKDVWTTKLKNRRAELVEENQRLVKLVFAPTSDKVWDMNAFNADPKQNVRYDIESLHQSRTINTMNFDSTVQVNQQDFFSLVDHRKKFEVYAKGVGLIYKFYKDNDILNFDTLNIRFGREVHYRVIDHGTE